MLTDTIPLLLVAAPCGLIVALLLELSKQYYLAMNRHLELLRDLYQQENSHGQLDPRRRLDDGDGSPREIQRQAQ